MDRVETQIIWQLSNIMNPSRVIDHWQHLKQNIFIPLQLNDTGYDIRANIWPERASGYWMKNGRVENAGYVDASVPFAAGGLYSTVEGLQQNA